MKAGDHHHAFSSTRKNTVGKPAYACTSPVFIDYGKAERLGRNSL